MCISHFACVWTHKTSCFLHAVNVHKKLYHVPVVYSNRKFEKIEIQCIAEILIKDVYHFDSQPLNFCYVHNHNLEKDFYIQFLLHLFPYQHLNCFCFSYNLKTVCWDESFSCGRLVRRISKVDEHGKTTHICWNRECPAMYINHWTISTCY